MPTDAKLMPLLELTFPGDASHESTFGGTTRNLLLALQRVHPGTVAVNLAADEMRKRKRIAWTLFELAAGRGVGGFQYSATNLNGLWSSLIETENCVYLNLFQLYGQDFFRRNKSPKYFYIDQTLTQLFAGYPQTPRVSRTHQQQAIAEERYQYQNAAAVFTMCDFARSSVIADYGVPQHRTKTILPGANIDKSLLGSLHISHPLEKTAAGYDRNDPLKLLFIGKDPERKGLFRLLDAIKLLPDGENRIALTIVGVNADSAPVAFRKMRGVAWLGRIDKSREFERFVSIVSQNDLGVLLSTAEATGLSLLEFQLLGLGVIAPRVGGAPELVAPGAGQFVESHDGASQIATLLANLLSSRQLVEDMKTAARAASPNLFWDKAASELIKELRRDLLGTISPPLL